MTNTIGNRISQSRKEKAITQEEMAERLGVTPQAVSKWENDISYPDILHFLKSLKSWMSVWMYFFPVKQKRNPYITKRAA